MSRMSRMISPWRALFFQGALFKLRHYRTQAKLAKAAGIGVPPVSNFDQGRSVSAHAVQAIQRALEAGGVEFTNGDQPGVKLKAKGKRK
jgi:CTP:molybdopterin cytidylyltransferase MocA